MKYRAYFRLKIQLLSPLSIGGSDSKYTDKDICLNSKNEPMIPASSIAGVYRSFGEIDQQKKYFGYVTDHKEVNSSEKDRKEIERIESLLSFYDAQLCSEESMKMPITRDGVALGEDKTALDGGKFDFQAVKTGAIFIGYIEAMSKEACDYMKELLKRKVSFGSKTTRGYGKVKVSYQLLEYNLEDKKSLESWLDFDMFRDFHEECKWLEGDMEQEADRIKIVLSLEQRGGLSIRQYLTEPAAADYGPLSVDGVPVIPGTSWAGLFRHNVSKLLGKDYSDEIANAFGYVDKVKKEAKKSQVWFSESRILDSESKLLVRNAIDRFTNGTKEGALYEESTIYGGNTQLEINLNKQAVTSEVISAICATIIDLNMGFVAIGGLTAVGRGLFSIRKICVNDTSFDRIDYTHLRAVISSV